MKKIFFLLLLFLSLGLTSCKNNSNKNEYVDYVIKSNVTIKLPDVDEYEIKVTAQADSEYLNVYTSNVNCLFNLKDGLVYRIKDDQKRLIYENQNGIDVFKTLLYVAHTDIMENKVGNVMGYGYSTDLLGMETLSKDFDNNYVVDNEKYNQYNISLYYNYYRLNSTIMEDKVHKLPKSLGSLVILMGTKKTEFSMTTSSINYLDIDLKDLKGLSIDNGNPEAIVYKKGVLPSDQLTKWSVQDLRISSLSKLFLVKYRQGENQYFTIVINDGTILEYQELINQIYNFGYNMKYVTKDGNTMEKEKVDLIKLMNNKEFLGYSKTYSCNLKFLENQEIWITFTD